VLKSKYTRKKGLTYKVFEEICKKMYQTLFEVTILGVIKKNLFKIIKMCH